MFRLAAVITIFLLSTPAFAWEARVSAVCELAHEGEAADVLVTYDPRNGQYAIAVTLDAPWPDAPSFGMRFDGPRVNTITTDRHVLSDGARTLTVTDHGFGNVLNGLEFNFVASAISGDQSVAISLTGAAPEVQKFRACVDGVGV